MKRYVRQIAMGLVLILLVGLLAGCGESTQKNGWSQPFIEPSRFDFVVDSTFAVLEVVEILDNVYKVHPDYDLMYVTTRCKLLYDDQDEKGEVQYFNFPLSWAEKLGPGQAVLVEYSGKNYGEHPLHYNKRVRHYDYEDADFSIAAFVDGKLVYDKVMMAREFSRLEEFNKYVEKRLSVPVEDRPAHYELLPPGPIGNGSTVEEVVHFFEAFRAFMSAEWNQDD